ncbi:PLP-dependent aminotransferase family protein [Shewanella sp. VB17]|uniref:aminotransferase-like domain-containing protein n=1 Tax=Shewanella sp. VB17 TaxID=2739432 RepID=UPI0015665911|nr:PLP-dependent aminotransferase family protein [Shewanella sp. VB17]NRD75712.1 PLP-dependent aminotransferase family protein [Shewanella sp. VB17]
MAEFKYLNIVDEMIRAIESGIFSDKTGRHKLTSLRCYAKNKGVGVSTVSQAYIELEKQGWIYSEPKKGYFVALKKESKQPDYGRKINRVHAQLDLANAVQYSFNDPDILALSCTAPSTVINQELLLNRLHKQVIRQRPYKLMMQTPIEGIVELRHEICRHLLRSGQVFSKDQVLVTNGRKEGLLLALAAAKTIGKTVAVESPVSFFFQTVLTQLNSDVIEVPMQENYTDELVLLTKAHKIQCFDTYLVNPNFADPTGRVLSVEDKQSLIEWANEHDVTLIEYDRGELSFGPSRPVTIASLVTQAQPCKVISIADFFDTISPAISLGYLLCINTFLSCQFAKQTMAEEPNIALQYMVTNVMSSGEYHTLVGKLRALMSVNYLKMKNLMKTVLADAIYMSQPSGGPSIWCKLPASYSSENLWGYVIKEKVSIAPGAMFSFDKRYDSYFRITFALPWDEKMEQGILRLAEVINAYLMENKH